MTGPCLTTGPYAYDPHVQVLWVEDIVDIENPTDDELALGIDLQDVYDLSDIIGWTIGSPPKQDGLWGAKAEQRLDKQVVPTSQLLFPAYLDGTDIRSLLRRGDAGHIVILPAGQYLDYPLSPVDVYQVKVTQAAVNHVLRGVAMVLVTFAVTTFADNVLVVATS